MKIAIVFLCLLTFGIPSFGTPVLFSFDVKVLHVIGEIIRKCPAEFSKLTSEFSKNGQTLVDLSGYSNKNAEDRAVIRTSLRAGYLPSPMSGSGRPQIVSTLYMVQTETPGPHPMDGGDFYETECSLDINK